MSDTPTSIQLVVYNYPYICINRAFRSVIAVDCNQIHTEALTEDGTKVLESNMPAWPQLGNSEGPSGKQNLQLLVTRPNLNLMKGCGLVLNEVGQVSFRQTRRGTTGKLSCLTCKGSEKCAHIHHILSTTTAYIRRNPQQKSGDLDNDGEFFQDPPTEQHSDDEGGAATDASRNANPQYLGRHVGIDISRRATNPPTPDQITAQDALLDSGIGRYHRSKCLECGCALEEAIGHSKVRVFFEHKVVSLSTIHSHCENSTCSQHGQKLHWDGMSERIVRISRDTVHMQSST